MKLGSLFDGSGGFPLAGRMCGINPIWASEVEPYPIAVTRSRFPNMKHLGSVTDIKGGDIEPVDIITFGSPCQDMSVAGKRKGIKHSEQGDEETTRSGLFYEAVRIIKEMREATNGKYPKYAVWENVPGAFSSNKGWDFHAVLEALCSVCDDTVSVPKPYDAKRTKLVWNKAGEIVGDNYSVAWRTLDAQYWGVPQRRKRIYLVADFTGRCAGEILFKPDSLRGYMPQGDEAGQGSSADAMGSVDGGVGVECLNPWDCQSKRIYNPDGIYCTLPAMDCGGANNQAVIFSFDSLSSNSMKSSNPISGCRAVDVAKCIDTTYPDPSKNQGGVAVVMATQQGGAEIAENLCPTITAAAGMSGNNQPVIAFAQNQRDEVRDLGDKAGALAAEAGVHQQTYIAQPVIALQANGIDRADTAGCNGAGWRENESYTLNTVDRHAVCYQESVGALQARDYKGVGNQYVSEEKLIIECYDARGNGDGETACTITGDHQNGITDYTAVAVQEAKPPRKYIIRRLTPTECARLQGFPDDWGKLAPYNPADAEFWEDVRKTHAEINGKTYKPVKDIKKWYDKLHTDSAEYKMWGNGIALPTALYVMQGLAEVNEKIYAG